MISLGDTHRVLVVDDEPDVAAVTRLSLRTLRYGGRAVELITAATGAEAVTAMRTRPDTSVILLDVVMESSTAGLDACRTIREDLDNRFVRILLRTGQPGVAPERATIDEYDIDGYLPKAELSSTRLYVAVRTALKAYEELVEVERHRQALSLINDSVVSLQSFQPLEVTLQRILATALALAGTDFAVLDLETFDHRGEPRRWLLHLSTAEDQAAAAGAAADIADRVADGAGGGTLRHPGPFDDGFLVPIVVHHDLGYGWLYLHGSVDDGLTRQALPLLAAHASNALYSTLAQAMLAEREGPFYDSLIV